MKLEKINENQIKCTLTKEDLERHQIRLSELAYGTEKAKQLFRDMMIQAQTQFGFQADNIPLMIEAIPINTECIILIITKVADPEELDTRFSKFSPYKGGMSSGAGAALQSDGADSILDLFQKLYEARQKMAGENADRAAEQKNDATGSSPDAGGLSLIRSYHFSRLDDVIAAAKALKGFYDGENYLYKPGRGAIYQLVIHQSDSTPEDFNKICNILSEYGEGYTLSASGEAYLKEHGELISQRALQSLAEL